MIQVRGAYMEKPVKVERYGQEVWETPAMDMLRKEHCMCLNCARMKPGEKENCKIAQKFYKICKKYGNAFMLTRCNSWLPIPLNIKTEDKVNKDVIEEDDSWEHTGVGA